MEQAPAENQRETYTQELIRIAQDSYRTTNMLEELENCYQQDPAFLADTLSFADMDEVKNALSTSEWSTLRAVAEHVSQQGSLGVASQTLKNNLPT